MSHSTRRMTACLALALGLATTMTLAQTTEASAKRSHRARMAKLRPAHQRPEYVGAPGFAGGGPVSSGPVAMANPGLLGGGGLLGAGVLPQTNLFYGVPVVGQLGL